MEVANFGAAIDTLIDQDGLPEIQCKPIALVLPLSRIYVKTLLGLEAKSESMKRSHTANPKS